MKMATAAKKATMLNIGKLNKKIKMFEEKRKSIEQNIQQLKKARGKLIGNLKMNSKISEEKVPTYKTLIGNPENKLEVKKKKESNLDEVLLQEFYHDETGDIAVMEATEIEEYATTLEFTNWDPSPIIGRKYMKTEDNLEIHGQPDSNIDDSFSLLNSSELEDTSDDDLFFTSTPKNTDKPYIMRRRAEAV